jgi:hypothetical protein
MTTTVYLYTLCGVLSLLCISLFIYQKSFKEDFVVCDSDCNIEILKQRFERERASLLLQLNHLKTLITDILGKDFIFEKPLKNVQNIDAISQRVLISNIDTEKFCKDTESTWNAKNYRNLNSTNRNDIVDNIVKTNSQYNEHLSIIYVIRKECLKHIDKFIQSIRDLNPNLSLICEEEHQTNCDLKKTDNIFDKSSENQKYLSSQYQNILNTVCLTVNYVRGLNALAKLSAILSISLSKK